MGDTPRLNRRRRRLEARGSLSGYSSGERAGERSGDANGERPGERSGDLAGDANGERAGDFSGERAGEANADRAGEANGDRAGEANADRAGEANADRAGEANADRAGEANGERPGERNVDRMVDFRTDRSERAKILTSVSSLIWSMAASLNWMSWPDVPSLLMTPPCRGYRIIARPVSGTSHGIGGPRAPGAPGDEGYVIEQDWSRIENLWSLVERASLRYGDRPFVESLDGGPALVTFSQLASVVGAVAGYFQRRGVAEGQRVAISLHNSPLLQLLFIATIAARRVLVPLNPGMAADEVAHVRRETDPALVIADRRLRRRLGSALAGVECELVDHDTAFMESLVRESQAEGATFGAASPDEDAEIVFMSGPSGRAKGVVLSHRSLVAGAWGVGEALGFEPGARFLTVSPLFHTSGQMSTTLAPLWTGGVTTAVRSDLAMLDFWGLVDRFRPHWTFVVNSFLALLLERGPRERSHSLRGVLAGGSRFTAELIEGFESTFGVRVHQCYGLTETAGTSTCEDADPATRSLGSAGRSLPVCSLRIMAGGREAPPGAAGEIEVRGPNLFTRYLHQPEMTEERMRDGWLRTGDAGRVDERGNLFIMGRADQMIIVGGEKLYPAEIERLVPELAGIEEAVVVPVPHPILGAELALVYRLRPAAGPDPEGWTEVLARSLSVFKVPRRFVSLDELGFQELPRAANGAVLREPIEEALRDRAGAGPSPRGSR